MCPAPEDEVDCDEDPVAEAPPDVVPVAKPEKILWEPVPVALPELEMVEAPDAVADAVTVEEVDP